MGAIQSAQGKFCIPADLKTAWIAANGGSGEPLIWKANGYKGGMPKRKAFEEIRKCLNECAPDNGCVPVTVGKNKLQRGTLEELKKATAKVFFGEEASDKTNKLFEEFSSAEGTLNTVLESEEFSGRLQKLIKDSYTSYKQSRRNNKIASKVQFIPGVKEIKQAEHTRILAEHARIQAERARERTCDQDWSSKDPIAKFRSGDLDYFSSLEKDDAGKYTRANHCEQLIREIEALDGFVPIFETCHTEDIVDIRNAIKKAQESAERIRAALKPPLSFLIGTV